MLVLVLAPRISMDVVDEAGPMDVGPVGASVYPAVQNLCLAARAHGLGVVVITVVRIHEAEARAAQFQGFQVNDDLMAATGRDTVFMHCLPAHRDEEVTPSVIDGPQSVVWDEAENRLHAQKALLEFLLHP